MNDPWEMLGELDGDEALHVLTRLYALFEADSADDQGRERFFVRLTQVIDQVRQCNLNRR